MFARRLLATCSCFAALVGSPLWAEDVQLSASIVEGSNGNTNIELQNVSEKPVTIISAVVNRKRNNPVCVLSPYRGFDDSTWFARSDVDEAQSIALSMTPISAITLQFGDEVSLSVYHGCGSVLELELRLDSGNLIYRIEP